MFTKKTRVISMIASVCMLISMLACIAVPAYADTDFDAMPSVSTITDTAAPDGDYKIASLEDWLHLDNGKESLFRSANITIHLTTEIDLTGATFGGFHNLKVKFDGHGNTVKNWGTAETPAASNGMFDAINNANGMVEIKNLKVADCHITHTGAEAAAGTALIYGVSNANAGVAGLPTEVLIENIEVSNSSVANDAENTAIILSRYASAGAVSTVTLRNIKITGTTLTTGSNHSGLLIGKPRGGNASDPTTYNIQNVILTGNTVKSTAAENGNGPAVGLLFGTAENSGATCINMANVYAQGNTLDASLRNNVGIMGTAQSNFVVNATGVVINDTTATVAEGSSVYMVNAGDKVSFTNVYSNATVAALTSNATEVALSTSKTAADAYAFNANAGTDSILYWALDAGELVPVAKEYATRKISLELTNGDPVETLYAAAGSEVTLSYAADPNATFSTANAAATIDGNKLTVPTDGSDVVVIITLGGDGELQQAKDDLQAAIDYYKVDRNTAYYVEALLTKIEEAEAALLDSTKTAGDYTALIAELEAFADQFVGYPNIPNVTEIEKYTAAPGLTIDDTDDLVWVSAHEGDFTADQTLYLTADLDMTGVSFEGFDASACFKFNGLNHTIANWTCEKTPADAGDTSMTARTGFFVSSNITSIKNVTFDNAQLTGGRESAIVYSTTKADAVSNKGLSIQNVHVKNSTLNAMGQHSSIFMCNLQDARKSSTAITFCSVIDTTLDFTDKFAGTGNNGSAFLGRAETTNIAGDVQIQNCYAKGFEIINGGENCSVFLGPTGITAAADKTPAIKIYNVAAIDCDIEGTTKVGILCARNSGLEIRFRDVLIYNCAATATAEGGFAGIAWGNQDWFGNNASFRTRLYFENTWNQSTWFVNTNAGATSTLEDAIADPVYFDKATDLPSVAYALNNQADADGWYNFWSINEDGDVEPTWVNGKYYISANGSHNAVSANADAFATDKAGAVRKINLVQASTGADLGVLYANGGATVDVTVEGATAYALADGTSATASIEGATLTMASDFTDVTVLVTLGDSAAMEGALAQLEALIDYFDAHQAEKSAELTEALNEAADIIADSTAFEVADAEACLLTLQGFRNSAPYLPRATEVDTYTDEVGYMLWDKTDFEYVSANAAKFNKAITLYMGADVDFSGSSFQRITNVMCDFDGMGNTITNYNPATNAGIFYGYKGTSIKNLTIKDSTAAGAYSRAILVSEAQNPGELVIDNVDMENVTLDANAAGNQMGLYISRTSAAGGKITIKNCEVTNCNLTNTCNAMVNNSGLMVGCIKENHAFLMENVVVKNSKVELETGAGGYLGGAFETSSTDVVFKNVGIIGGNITVADGTTTAGIMVGIHNASCPPTFENCFAFGVATPDGVEAAWARGWEGQGSTHNVSDCQIALLNCSADFNDAYPIINNSAGVPTDSLAGVLDPAYVIGLAHSDTLAGIVWNANGGNTVWTMNAEGTDVALGAKEGYGVPFQITFTSGVGENATQVGTCYTGIDGKLPASAAWLVEDPMYTWSLGEDAVDMNYVFTADADVVSTVVHSFEGGELVPNGDGTHKVLCAEDHECTISKDVDCVHEEYRVNTDADTHTSLCACGYEIATEACEIEYTFDGVDSHTGLCETCERTTAKELCNMSDFTILPGDEPTTEKAGCKTSSCDKCDHEETIILNQLAAAKVVVEGGESVILGETYSFELKLEGNTAPGVSGLVAKVTYDADKWALDYSALNPTSGFTGEIDTTVPGEIKIGLVSATPVTAEAIFAAFDLIATDDSAKAGATDIDVEVYDVVLSGTEMDDASVIDLDMEAEGLSVNIVDFTPGDVNMDGNITIADVVLVLRVVNQTLDAEHIDMLAADVVGDTAGVDTADAIQILKYVLGEIDAL